MDRTSIGDRALTFFENLWKDGDFWDLEASEFEQTKYRRQLAMIEGRRYARTLEIGCGAGAFTCYLAKIADHVTALDISPTAIERGRARGAAAGPGVVEFRVANVMDYDLRAEAPWDLVVMSETIYYLGWLYPFFDVGWLAAQLFDSTRDGGRVLMANTCGGVEDYLLRPWLIRTYRDLFVNVGYQLQSEEMFDGNKEHVPIKTLISLFIKRPSGTPAGPHLGVQVRSDP